jgi:hypothetical protein
MFILFHTAGGDDVLLIDVKRHFLFNGGDTLCQLH